ncbi:MAG: hypothetical protein H6772_02435 [Pseudomonadales bacterium]|nr:hypothetical protein [Pseudomonadales bacterium]
MTEKIIDGESPINLLNKALENDNLELISKSKDIKSLVDSGILTEGQANSLAKFINGKSAMIYRENGELPTIQYFYKAVSIRKMVVLTQIDEQIYAGVIGSGTTLVNMDIISNFSIDDYNLNAKQKRIDRTDGMDAILKADYDYHERNTQKNIR